MFYLGGEHPHQPPHKDNFMLKSKLLQVAAMSSLLLAGAALWPSSHSIASTGEKMQVEPPIIHFPCFPDDLPIPIWPRPPCRPHLFQIKDGGFIKVNDEARIACMAACNAMWAMGPFVAPAVAACMAACPAAIRN